jgi:nucleoside-diphosphate-sugar epimerase
MERSDLILVTGAGGFIGGHLVAELRRRGHRRIRAVDIKPFDEWYQTFDDVDNRSLDLREIGACHQSASGARYVFNLAADMGGMGFIELHKAECMLTVLINTHMLMAAQAAGAERFFYSSSACVYAAEKQTSAAVQPLREPDAYPAMPEDGYGWEKLFSERMCRHFTEDYGIVTRVARYHNVYGPYGTYDGGREKAPAAVCRKVIAALQSGSGEIEIWGDGEQTRSFTYIDDCLESIADVKLKRRYKLDAPKGVRGRNSDNTLIRQRLGWAPSIRLEEGMRQTYGWIHEQMTRAGSRVLA